jgi:hypothetical protein
MMDEVIPVILHEYTIVGFLFFLDIIILYSYFSKTRKTKPYTKYGVSSLVFLFTTLWIYLTLNFLDILTIPYFYLILSIITVPWIILGIVINVKNDAEIRENLLSRLYRLFGILLFLGIVFLLAVTVIGPVEKNYGTSMAFGCFLLFIAIWYFIPVFSYQKFMWLKEASFSIFFILLSILSFIDFFNKIAIGIVVAISIIIYMFGRIIVNRYDNGIYINRKY